MIKTHCSNFRIITAIFACQFVLNFYGILNVYVFWFFRISEAERKQRLEEQAKTNDYHRFVEGNLILKQGLVDKRKVSGIDSIDVLVYSVFNNR